MFGQNSDIRRNLVPLGAKVEEGQVTLISVYRMFDKNIQVTDSEAEAVGAIALIPGRQLYTGNGSMRLGPIVDRDKDTSPVQWAAGSWIVMTEAEMLGQKELGGVYNF